MSNVLLTEKIFSALAQSGVREIVLCAGARNAPIVDWISQCSHFKLYSFFEERSAAFFALGRILDSGRPVAVVTTSGTAAAELLPATIEADYQALPLVLVTADRPSRYRGSGAPQTIIQPGLFSHYVEHSWDLEFSFSETFKWSRRRPIHVNVCFDEPLLSPRTTAPIEIPMKAEVSSAAPLNSARPLELSFKKPLILLSGLSMARAETLIPFLQQWRRPVWCEATSRLRHHPLLEELEICGGEGSLKNIEMDSVIRLGGVPTLRFWRDLENSALPVLNFSDLPFSGLPRTSEVFAMDQLLHANVQFTPWSEQERSADRDRAQNLDDLITEFPLSEPAWVRWLSRQIPFEARIFLGNSLPIREWDLAACTGHYDVFANRGVNGIDGLISTFAGVAEPTRPNWAVVGDLSALYDLSGPWAFRQRALPEASIAIINNGGGKIFERMFRNPLFENRHDLNFKHWAAMWNLTYHRVESAPLELARPAPQVLEILPSDEQTAEFWRRWETR